MNQKCVFDLNFEEKNLIYFLFSTIQFVVVFYTYTHAKRGEKYKMQVAKSSKSQIFMYNIYVNT